MVNECLIVFRQQAIFLSAIIKAKFVLYNGSIDTYLKLDEDLNITFFSINFTKQWLN